MKTQLGIPHDAEAYEAAVRAENKKRREALGQLVDAAAARAYPMRVSVGLGLNAVKEGRTFMTAPVVES